VYDKTESAIPKKKNERKERAELDKYSGKVV
jgi:hypothetical protein